jgi:type IV pilus assembly protein PilM
MSKRNSCWGIEVGAYAIKGVRLVAEGKDVRLAEYDTLPFKHVLTTPDLNADEAIQLGLDQFLARHDLTHSTVIVSVPGHMALARFAKLPPVEPKKILDIVRFEAVQQVPFPLDQVEWDYQVFAQEDSPDVEVGIFAITKDRVSQFLANYRAVHLRIDGLTLSPLAMYNAMAYDLRLQPDSPGLVFMDIGTSSTDVVIVDAGRIWLRTLPIGGNNFTEALVRAFKLSFPKAEKLKREAATSKYARQIFQAMRPVFADLVQEIQRSLGFYQAMNRDAKLSKVIGMGSTFRLPGLQKFLKQQLQMDVDRPTSADGKQPGFGRISAEGAQAADFAEQALNLVTAYGLALQGLGLAQVNANILPGYIVRQRMWRAKQPWFATAAALTLAASGAALWQLLQVREAAALTENQNKAHLDQVEKFAHGFLVQLDAVHKDDRRPQMQECMQILTYRDLGAMLYDDLVQAGKAVIDPRNPQDALDRTNYEEVRQIPRTARRRVVIETCDVKYLPTAVPDGWKTPGALIKPWDQAIDQLGGPAAGTPTAVSNPGGTSGSDAKSPAALTTGHSFLVTIHGYLPYADNTNGAVRLLAANFMGYLRDHAARAERPYVLEVNTDKMEQSLYSPGGPSRPPSGNPFPGPPMLFPAVAPPPSAAPGGASGTTDDWRLYVPNNPLAGEDRSHDTVFTIQWVVQIKAPGLIENYTVQANKPAPAAAPLPTPVPAPAAAPAPAPAPPPSTTSGTQPANR